MVFIESRIFTRRLHELAEGHADEILRGIHKDLLSDPDRGAIVPGLGGIRKARTSNPTRGKGKRGGFRYLYLYLERRHHIHLLLLLDKNQQHNATQEQKRQIRSWAAQIRGETGPDMTKKIKVNIFEDMREAMQEALAYERGEAVDLRVTRLPSPPKPVSPREIRRIRKSLNASQALFASYLNVSANAVRSWEQGTRRPQHAALKLLVIAKKNPHALLVA